jgi:porphobilinogen synthase
MVYPIHQLKRLRRTSALRDLVQETRLTSAELIYPLFIVPGKNQEQPIHSMPEQYRYSPDALMPILEKINASGVKTILLFGQADVKDAQGYSVYAADSCVVQALAVIKKYNPEWVVITDVCLCSYTTHGHCGLLKVLPNGQRIIDNPKTLEVISKAAVVYAQAGADIVAPSGMADGMVAAIRAQLDRQHLDHVAILAYAVKYASSFYGPFREAADCAPEEGDRRGYQMNFANKKEALLEAAFDVEEGADLLMVKPGLPYLDVLSELTQHFSLPVFAYQVSGEYSMIKAAAQQGWLNEQQAVLESLLALKRAGARAIITYFALSVDLGAR